MVASNIRLYRREAGSLTTASSCLEEGQTDPQAFAPLSLLMENSILIPLRAQLKVANAAALNHLLVDAGLMAHFSAARNYLLFHDGEFAHQLSSSLFREIRDAVVPTDVVNPSTLNRIVENALLSSTFGSKVRKVCCWNDEFILKPEYVLLFPASITRIPSPPTWASCCGIPRSWRTPTTRDLPSPQTTR